MAKPASGPGGIRTLAEANLALAGAEWLNARGCQAVFEAIEVGGFCARAVGGAVRNTLMGVSVADVDIATDALPDDVMRLARSAGLGVHPTGLSHGTVTVVADGSAYEVTTLRRDVEAHGRHATVSFTADWAEDASRRDFTINALYCSRRGCLFDPLGGFEDVRSSRVRFIGSPQDRIREDYLRILRFFRFFASYGDGEIDPSGYAAVLGERDGLSTLSAERIRVEMLKLVSAPRSVDTLALMQKGRILALVLGTDGDRRRFERLIAIETELAIRSDPIIRLGVLAVNSPNESHRLAQRLRLSNDERTRLVNLAEVLESPISFNLGEQKVWLYRLGREAYRDRCLMAWASETSSGNAPDWRQAFELPDVWEVPEMPFSGKDIIDRGVLPGPRVGEFLAKFEDWWLDAGFPLERELLISKLDRLIKG
ncbi:MAG: CCA tRNA nucleotidyltransferase [Alphaproteobacteria bacterium]|nr:CCA tRNA nucleotidyltransferase [Alphaproteobacteria bacterium]